MEPAGADEILVDGEHFIAVAKLGRTHGFAPDYVARLCRTGQIQGRRLVDRKWYASEHSLRQFMLAQAALREQKRQQLSQELRRVHSAGVLGTPGDLSAGFNASRNPDNDGIEVPARVPPFAAVDAFRDNAERALPPSSVTLPPAAPSIINAPASPQPRARSSTQTDRRRSRALADVRITASHVSSGQGSAARSRVPTLPTSTPTPGHQAASSPTALTAPTSDQRVVPPIPRATLITPCPHSKM